MSAPLRNPWRTLDFKFSDVKILLGNHAHGDHMEGDALVKELTGAQVVAMAEDVPALQKMKPGGKDHPIDRIIHDGDTVTLGDTTLTAHLTPGHTRGCYALWTMRKRREGAESYDVVFHCSLRAGGRVTPAAEEEFKRTFPLVRRALPCDVPLGDHPSQYSMQEKFAKLHAGGPNPFIDRAGCNLETDVEEAMFHAILQEQQKGTTHLRQTFYGTIGLRLLSRHASFTYAWRTTHNRKSWRTTANRKKLWPIHGHRPTGHRSHQSSACVSGFRSDSERGVGRRSMPPSLPTPCSA